MTHQRLPLLLAALALALPAARADDDLDDLKEKAIKAAVARVAPCVVQIETPGGTDMVQSAGGGMIRRGIGPTSGLIVSADGYIISSAFNFANKPATIVVSVPGQKERYVAKVVATDQTRMLTLLKIEAAGLPVPAPAPKADIKIGQTALAVGRTLPDSIDEPPSVSVGIISALGRIWGKAMQTDAKVSPTNYGGPLVDLPAASRASSCRRRPTPRARRPASSGTTPASASPSRSKTSTPCCRGSRRGTTSSAAFSASTCRCRTRTRRRRWWHRRARLGGRQGRHQARRQHQGDRRQAGRDAGASCSTRLGTKYEGDMVAVTLDRGGKEINLPAVALAGVSQRSARPSSACCRCATTPGRAWRCATSIRIARRTRPASRPATAS